MLLSAVLHHRAALCLYRAAVVQGMYNNQLKHMHQGAFSVTREVMQSEIVLVCADAFAAADKLPRATDGDRCLVLWHSSGTCMWTRAGIEPKSLGLVGNWCCCSSSGRCLVMSDCMPLEALAC